MSSTRRYKRQLVPRWFNSQTAAESGLVGSSSESIESADNQFRYIVAERDWDRKKDVSSAVELVSSAIMFSDWSSKKAVDAAGMILESASSSSSAREISDIFLRGSELSPSSISFSSVSNYQLMVSLLRRSIDKNPFDPLSWMDMAFCHAYLSNEDKAIKSLRVAASLAPSSVLIVRTAARALLHYGRNDEAIRLLRNSYAHTGRVEFAVSEAAIASRLNEGSKLLSVISKKYRSGFHSMSKGKVWSEIGSVLATMESESGAHRKSRKIASSVQHLIADENVLAQMEWLSQEEKFELNFRPDLPADFEADALASFNSGNFVDAVDHCKLWAAYQPFSSAPSVHGSYVASLALADFEVAESLAAIGYQFSRSEFMACNNYAFSLAANGKVDRAIEVICGIDKSNLDRKDLLTLAATNGFIAYKAGDVQSGRALYKSAMQGFKADKNQKSLVVASHFWLQVDIDAPVDKKKMLSIAKSEGLKELLYFYDRK